MTDMQQTSLDAYEKALEKLGDNQRKVYEVIRFFEYATNSMIAQHLNWSINRVTPRVKELRDAGLVVEAFRTVCPITRNKAIYWKLK